MGKVLEFKKGGVFFMSSIEDVAKAFLTFEPMTHKKLQKLCYYAQAWHWALYDEPMFDAEFQAWIHGPVCPSLYDQYRDCGWKPIEYAGGMPKSINDGEKEFINQIYRIYGGLTGDQLEMLTHSETPWLNARIGVKANEPSTEAIDPNDMRTFYLAEYERSQND